MQELKISGGHKSVLQDFTDNLRGIFKDELVSVILYGSAARGEFTGRESNLNVLIVLKDAGLANLKKCTGLVNRFKFRALDPFFLSRKYISDSLDVFPIEFLDMKENYAVLYGEDILKDIQVDTKNLRFQCEQELKAKLVSLRQAYLRQSRNGAALKYLMFRYATSLLHILKNMLRVKGKTAPFLRQDILDQAAQELKIKTSALSRILSAKNKEIALGRGDLGPLFVEFTEELEKISDIVDQL
ncbi:MAG: nucleotidyltransferase domain-containing protein [Candidatus Omnitrophota bacterium]